MVRHKVWNQHIYTMHEQLSDYLFRNVKWPISWALRQLIEQPNIPSEQSILKHVSNNSVKLLVTKA